MAKILVVTDSGEPVLTITEAERYNLYNHADRIRMTNLVRDALDKIRLDIRTNTTS